ncbi:hypothetical protein ACFL6C_00090 [Myxococcota bacterium]
MRCIAVVATLFAFVLGGCKEDPQPETKPDEPAAVEPTGAAEPAEPEPAAELEQAYLTHVTGLRREPTEAKKVEIEGKKKKVNNWVMTLYRGEEVTVQEVRGEWTRVSASDDSEGWVKKNGLLPIEGVSLATVFEKAKTFYRPDLLAQNTSRMIDPASLLFILKTKDQFTEVNYYGQGKSWVLSDKLNADPKEISAAKLLAKVQWLKSRKDPDADKVMELARTQFGDSRLVGMADEEGKVKEEPAEGDEAAADEAKKEEPAPAKTE